MAYERFPGALAPLTFHVLEPLMKERERFRFQGSRQFARVAKATDERGNIVSPDLAQLCGDLLSDMFIAEDARTSHVLTAPISPNVPYFRLHVDAPASEILRTVSQKTEELNKHVMGLRGNSRLYLTLQNLESQRYAAATLAGFGSRGVFIYPIVRSMFGHLGLAPERTTMAQPRLVQKAGPVMQRAPYLS